MNKLPMRHTTAGIVARATLNALELGGSLEQHVGCSFDCWVQDSKRTLPQTQIEQVRNNLAILGYNW